LCNKSQGLADDGRALQSIDRDGVAEAAMTSNRSALAIAVGLIFALETVPAARAQVTVDMSKITCQQLVGYQITNPQNIAYWLSGYYHGKRGETTVDTLQLTEYAKKVEDYCLRNPKTLVMQAVETLIERTR